MWIHDLGTVLQWNPVHEHFLITILPKEMGDVGGHQVFIIGPQTMERRRSDPRSPIPDPPPSVGFLSSAVSFLITFKSQWNYDICWLLFFYPIINIWKNETVIEIGFMPQIHQNDFHWLKNLRQPPKWEHWTTPTPGVDANSLSLYARRLGTSDRCRCLPGRQCRAHTISIFSHFPLQRAVCLSRFCFCFVFVFV